MGRLLAISDIHGCYDTFHELIITSLEITRSDRLVLLGDYIDRGSKSMEVIDLIIDLQKKGFDIIPLAGNHEVMLLDSLKDNRMLPLWLMNNGLTTLESFSVGSVNEIGSKYIDFLSGLKFFENSGDILFVHAGFNDNSDNPFGDINGMIWESHASYNHPLLRGRIIIHGHRPKTPDFVKGTISSGASVIPIDTGCVYTETPGLGFLTALDVNSMKTISLKNIEKY